MSLSLQRPAPEAEPPIRVMLCDDSLVIRGAIGRMLEQEPGIVVAARVSNGQLAIDEVRRAVAVQPFDVLVLDIEMPVMDGLAALPALLRADPQLRVIMASTLTTRGADIALRALRLGAADYIPKPGAAEIANDSFRRELVAKIRGLARLRRRRSGAPALLRRPQAAPPAALRPRPARRPRLLAVGSSTGGPQALFALVQGLGPAIQLPVVITQHMPPTFTKILAEHIDKLGIRPCTEARDGDVLEAGHIYLAPGDHHLLVNANGETLRAKLTRDPPENFCRPSVDPMLRSAAAACDGRVLVVMLTGMGHDGLAGTRQVVEAGGAAIAQDEATSVVWGMPGAIALAGLCHAVLPLPEIGPKVLEMVRA